MLYRATAAAAVLCALCCCVTPARGEDVSREPPKAYADHAAPLLTPADDVLKRKADAPAGDEPAVALLYETVRRVDAAGRGFIVIHQVDLARDEEGARRLAKDTFSFRRTEQKIHLVSARTIRPDGTSLPVAANAAFVQTPQREGDASLYSDHGELVVLFPNVHAGAARESVVVIEGPVGRIDDEFTAMLPFGSYWPMARVRHVVDLDPGLAKRLSVTPLGQGVPEPARAEAPGGRVRLTWQRDRVPKTTYEPDRAPVDQTGPVVYLSTLKDWDAFGAWYGKLLDGRGAARGPLAEHVAARTKGLTDPAAVLSALLRDAARDVRYTGLEFGVAGFQPYDPNEVWANRYGDCKDKSNLLRVMLRARGVPAYLALVNTEHAGRVERRSPDYRHFNHAIVAVAQPGGGGGYMFCDPTIRHARPGMIRPDDADREVLLVKDGGRVEFVRTPPQDAGAVTYDLDLKRAADGALSGWLTVDATGYQAASWAEYAGADREREQVRNRMLTVVQEFYKAAELIDVEPGAAPDERGAFRARAYFVVPAGGGHAADHARDTLAFPVPDYVLPDFGDYRARETVYWQERSRREVRARVQLPAGWSGVDVPRPFDVAAAPVAAAAAWEARGSTVSARFTYEARQSQVPVEQFPLMYNAVTSLRSWLARPLSIAKGARGGDVVVASTAPSTRGAAATQPLLADFPLMPSGEGQLELVERKFPLDGGGAGGVNGGPSLRREALLKVLQWFPDDRASQFVAGVRLAELDLRHDPADAAALDRVRRLVAGARGQLDVRYLAWGEYALALLLNKAGQTAEAVGVMTRIAGDAQMSGDRRAWASVAAAQWTRADDPDRAVALLDASLDFETDAGPAQYAMLAEVLVRQRRQPAELRKRVDALLARTPQRAGQVLERLVADAGRYLDEDDRDTAVAVLDVVGAAVDRDPAALAHLRGDVAAARDRAASSNTLAEAAASLKAFVERSPPAWWATTPVDPALRTREQWRRAVQQAADGSTYEPYVRVSVEYLTRLTPDASDFTQRLWHLSATLYARDRDRPLLEHVLALLDRVPDSDAWHHEAKLVRADLLSARKGEHAAGLAVARAVADHPKPNAAIRHAGIRKAGEILERMRNYPAALAQYRRLEADLSANIKSPDAVLRAAFINLARGDRAEAQRLCGVLGGLAPESVDAAQSPGQLREMADLAKDPAAAGRFWGREASWWPRWVALEAKFGLPPLGEEVVVPVIPDETAFGREMGAAIRARDRARFYQLYRTIAHAARWQPRMVGEWAGLFSTATQVGPQHAGELREVVLAATAGLDVPDALATRAARMHQAAHLIDAPRPVDALAVVRADLAAGPPNDHLRQAMHRLWLLAAVHAAAGPAEVLKAVRAAEADLASPDGVADRARTVSTLCDGYRALNRTADERAMLARELTNPVVRDDPNAGEALRTRLQALNRQAEESDRVGDVFTAWIEAHKPAWWDYAEPRRLEDVRLDDLDAALKDPPADMLPAEVAKLALLVAAAPGQPLARRGAAFNLGVERLGDLCARSDEAERLYASLHGHPGLPEAARRHWLWCAAIARAMSGGDLEPFRRHPLAAGLADGPRTFLAETAALLKVDQDDPAALAAFVAEARERPLTRQRLPQVEDAFRRLARLDPAAARRAYEAGARLTVDPGAERSPAAVRLGLLRTLNAAERVFAADEAARALVLKAAGIDAGTGDDGGAAPSTRPAAAASTHLVKDWRRIRDLSDLTGLSRDAAHAVRLEMARQRRHDPFDIDFWADLATHDEAGRGDNAHARAVFEALLANAKQDEDRARLALAATEFFDTDVPLHREQAAAVLKPYRDPERHPMTYASIRIREVSEAVRTGRGPPVDVEGELRNVRHPMLPRAATRMAIRRAVQQRDADALRRVLGGMSPDDLLAPRTIPTMLPALEAAGMRDEAALLREDGRRALYRAALRSWSEPPNRADILHTLSLAKALGAAADQVPQGWVDHCTTAAGDEEVRAQVRAGVAELRRDWPALLAASDEVLRYQPRLYSTYRDKGRALFELGRKAEAAAALETYLKFCHDEIEYPDAVALLAKAKAKDD